MAADPQDAPRHAGQVVRRVLLRRNIAIDAETAQLVAAAVQAALQPAAPSRPPRRRPRVPAADCEPLFLYGTGYPPACLQLPDNRETGRSGPGRGSGGSWAGRCWPPPPADGSGRVTCGSWCAVWPARPGSALGSSCRRTPCAIRRSPSPWTPALRCAMYRTMPATKIPARLAATITPATAWTATPPTPSLPTWRDRYRSLPPFIPRTTTARTHWPRRPKARYVG